MLEIEVKSHYNDLDDIEDDLLAMGASFKKEVEQVDEYLGHPCRDFKVTDEALRIRQENGEYAIYYKGPKLDKETKTREEISTKIDDPGSMRTILQRLGFVQEWEVAKRRRVFELDDIEISLDRVKDLGNFIELETHGEDIDEGKKRLFELMSRLGIKESVRSSYLELLIEKKRGA